MNSKFGSYRTYEEWKHDSYHSFAIAPSVGSYRTYEEWKHGNVSPELEAYFGSYRTYEEWKLLVLRSCH